MEFLDKKLSCFFPTKSVPYGDNQDVAEVMFKGDHRRSIDV